mgnify:FL=1
MEKKILIIDDDADIRFTVREICKLRKWRTLEAACYEEAAPLLERERPDLILMDYHMPGLGGVRAIQEIRRTNYSIPIIVLTIEEREAIVNRFFEAGADDYSVKPIKALDLVARINTHLRYREQLYADGSKNITPHTLRMIEDCLRSFNDPVDIETLGANLDISSKTLYRYLQYMLRSGVVVADSSYGKVGRPKTFYKLRQQ